MFIYRIVALGPQVSIQVGTIVWVVWRQMDGIVRRAELRMGIRCTSSLPGGCSMVSVNLFTYDACPLGFS